MYRQAFSLLEVMIAMALTVTVLAAMTQILKTNQDFEGQQRAEDDLIADAAQLNRIISADMSQSGWHTVPTGSYASGALISITAPSALTNAGIADRALQYWPFVMTQRNASLCTQFALMNRTAAMRTLTLPTDLGGSPADSTGNFFTGATAAMFDGLDALSTAAGARQATVKTTRAGFFKSWYAPSQELVFLKQISDNGWTLTPNKKNNPRLGFRRSANGVDLDWNDTSDATRAKLGVLFPSPYYKPTTSTFGLRPGLTVTYGAPMNATVLDQTDSSKFTFRTAWQTISAPTYLADNVAIAAAAPDTALRQFVYAVVPPGPRGLGLGRLVRAYKVRFSVLGSTPTTGTDPGQLIASDGTYGLVVDEVLTEHCVRAVFDTARTDTSLALNEIRARIYLLRRSNADRNTLVKQVIDLRATMRSRNTYTDRVTNDQPIFTPASGVPGYVY